MMTLKEKKGKQSMHLKSFLQKKYDDIYLRKTQPNTISA